MEPVDPRISRLDALDKPSRLSPAELDPEGIRSREGRSIAEQASTITYPHPVDNSWKLWIFLIVGVVVSNIAVFSLIAYWYNSNG